MGLKKSTKRKIGISELKARGFSYQEIGERIRVVKKLGYVPMPFPATPQIEPLLPVDEEALRLQMEKEISVWQRFVRWIIRKFKRG